MLWVQEDGADDCRRLATLAAADELSCACVHADAISEIPWCGFVLALKFLLGLMLSVSYPFIPNIRLIYCLGCENC